MWTLPNLESDRNPQGLRLGMTSYGLQKPLAMGPAKQLAVFA